MSGGQGDGDGGGCAGCFLVVMAIGLVIVVLISTAAIVDPFSWMPAVGEVWAECEDDLGTSADECALEERFPGFWLHAFVNLMYAAVAFTLVVAFAGAVVELRAKRPPRFDGVEEAAACRRATGHCVGCGIALAVLALTPVVVAVA
jgi:hypothetical protein